MPFERYRVMQRSIAVFEQDGRHVAGHVPTGAIILVDGTLDENKLTNVVWDGKKVMVFTQDLRTRADLEPSNSK